MKIYTFAQNSCRAGQVVVSPPDDADDDRDFECVEGLPESIWDEATNEIDRLRSIPAGEFRADDGFALRRWNNILEEVERYI